MQFLRTFWGNASNNFYSRDVIDKVNISISLPHYIAFAIVSRAIWLDYKASQIKAMSTLKELKEWNRTSGAMLRPTDQYAMENLVVRLERGRDKRLANGSTETSSVVNMLPEVANVWKDERDKGW